MSGRLRATLAAGAVVAAAGGGGAWAGVAASAPASSGTAANGSGTATGLAPIVRANLASQTVVPGTIGYDGSFTVVLPAGSTTAALAQAHLKVTTDGLAAAAAQTAQADAVTAGDQGVAQAKQALAAAKAAVADDQAQLQRDQAAPQPPAIAADDQALARDEASVAEDADAVTTAQQHATQTEHQVAAQLAAANAGLTGDQAALAQAQRTALNAGTTFTAIAGPGHLVTEGQPLYALDGKAVPLLYGPVTVWRAFSAAMGDGPDVAELNAALAALRLETGPSPGAHFADSTAAAVSRFQASLGLPQTGGLALGDVVFEPGPLRVASVSVDPGGPAQAGSTVLTATSNALVATAQVPLTNVGSLKPGAAVTIDLPDGRTGIPGRVRDVGASVTTASGNGNQQQASNGGGAQGGTPAASVGATVTFSDPSVAVGLDQGAVLVHVTTATAASVLAVPVDALLALSGGAEGVEVVSGGVHRVVAVQVGLFTGTQVQIQGPGLAPGMTVVVPVQ